MNAVQQRFDRAGRGTAIYGVLALLLTGCGAGDASADDPGATERENFQAQDTESVEGGASTDEEADDEQPETLAQEETCDWGSPRLSAPAEAPEGQIGELPKVLVGSWQHTHTDEGSGFEEVTNDHRYVLPSPDRMLYCQHVPGATDYAENAADIVLNETVIELPGGKYTYTLTAWDDDTLVWDNPAGGGYTYLLQRR